MSSSLRMRIRNLRLVVMAAVVCSSVSLPVWADYQNPAYQRGLREMSRRDYDGAINSFGEAIGYSMAEPKLYFLRGQCFFHIDSYDKALTDFDHCLQQEPKNSDVLLWKGTTYAKLGDEDKATRAYLNAMRANPQLVEQFQKNGGAGSATVNSKNEASVRAYEKAVKLYSSEGNSNDLKDRKSAGVSVDANSDSTLSKTARRVEDIDAAIQMDPSNPGLYLERGRAYKRMGDLTRAIADFTDAIKLNPMIAVYYLDRARCYHEQGKQTLCRSDIKKAQSVDPKVPRHINFVDEEATNK